MDFEKKLKEIEAISARLQSDDIGLDEGIALFEKSVILTKECLAYLSESKQKIETIKRDLDLLLSDGD
ncbi:MAG: exodeoxyribonuclease VII small subunit [Firmicutes bacterium]|nr:exodeoxyribonuclease VII small subunit [Bacillota bacterium]